MTQLSVMNAADGGLSLSPLGVRCSGGLLAFEGTYVAQDFVMLAVGIGLFVLAGTSAFLISAHGRRRKLPH